MGPVMMIGNGPAIGGRSLGSGELGAFPLPAANPVGTSAEAPFNLAGSGRDRAEDETSPEGGTAGLALSALPALASLAVGMPLPHSAFIASVDQTAPDTGEPGETARGAVPASRDGSTDPGTAMRALSGLPDDIGAAEMPPSPRSDRKTTTTSPAQTRQDAASPAVETAGPVHGAPPAKARPVTDLAAPGTNTADTAAAPVAQDAQVSPSPRPAPLVPATPAVTTSETAEDDPDPAPTDDLSPAETGRQEVRALDSTRSSGPKSVQPALPQHLSAQMTSAIRHSQDGTVEIALNPEELGRVRLSLQGDTTRLHVAIQFERAETQDLMRRHIAQLESDFQDLGYSQVSFDFGNSPSGNSPEPPVPSDPGTTSAPESPTDTGPPFATRPVATAAATSGGLDLRI